MNLYYILRDGQPVHEPDLDVWGQWMEENKGARQVAVDEIEGARISTCFLGLNHGYGEGPPVLFETLVFDGPHDGDQERYCTRDEALAGHQKFVENVVTGGDK